jgi:serine/threonine protein kinase
MTIIVTGIVCGLKFIHSTGFVHRDVKPSNLLIDKYGRCYIGDLESSRSLEAATWLSDDRSTIAYAAPELYDREYNSKVDVDGVRPGRPLIDVSAQIPRLPNDEPFRSTRHLARQLAITKKVVKRNLQEVLEFHKFSLKWVPNVVSAEQKAARVRMSRDLYGNLIFERQKNFAIIITGHESWYYWSYAESSIWERSHDDGPTSPLGKIDSKSRCSQYFSAARNLHFLILYQKVRIRILTISETLFWKGSKPAPLLEHEKRL